MGEDLSGYNWGRFQFRRHRGSSASTDRRCVSFYHNPLRARFPGSRDGRREWARHQRRGYPGPLPVEDLGCALAAAGKGPGSPPLRGFVRENGGGEEAKAGNLVGDAGLRSCPRSPPPTAYSPRSRRSGSSSGRQAVRRGAGSGSQVGDYLRRSWAHHLTAPGDRGAPRLGEKLEGAGSSRIGPAAKA